MNFKVISRNVGFALLTSAAFMFLSILISVANGNDSALAALVISFTLTFTVGVFPFIFVKKTSEISLKDGYMIIVLSWILSFVFGMLPYLLWGGPFTVVNALFESVSGYTTMGGTILESVENLPNSLLFWRSSTHFIGGLGVVVFLLLVIPSSSPVKLRLTNMELSSLSRGSYMTRTDRAVWVFASVYCALTLVSFLSYWVAGMSAFDAINHAFSVCATGGFSTKNMSIASFNSPTINLITIVFMFLASVHFGLIYLAVVNRTLKPFKNPVFKVYLASILFAGLFIAVSMRYGMPDRTWGDALMDSFFHVVSFVTTTGFAISDNNLWPHFTMVLLTVMIFSCGMAGSTAGGVKIDRMYMLLKMIVHEVRKRMHPSSVRNLTYGNVSVREEDIYPHILFIGMYLMVLGLSVFFLSIFGMDLGESLVSSLASLSDVGPGIGSMGTFGNYNGISIGAKLIMIFDMFLGRLEIYPVLALLMLAFDRKK